MKKYFLLLPLIALCSQAWAQTLNRPQLREYFLESLKRRSALDSFTAILEKNTARTAPEECYLGICNAMQIQYLSGMWSKYKMLDKSRDHVNRSLAAAPQDAEIHFMRFMLEHNIPSFLGMSTHIREDIAFVFSHTTFMDDDADMKKMAMEYMLASKRCTPDQRLALERSLSDLKKKLYAQK
jgi:hypothetical protein